MNIEALEKLGWDQFFQKQWDDLGKDKWRPARVIGANKLGFVVNGGDGEELVTVKGSLRRKNSELYPAVGDWVALKDTVLTKVLERKNALARGAVNAQRVVAQRKQIIATNLDKVFIVTGLDRDFNLRRVERYLTLVHNCSIDPVIILTKADLQSDVDGCIAQIRDLAADVPIHAVSSTEGKGVQGVESYLVEGQTIALIGSSGVGKSTLLNCIAGKEIQKTGSVSETLGKGKHTTTTRDLVILPSGGMIVDNPGTREVALWDSNDGVADTFPEILALGEDCKFSNCTHQHEPECNVQRAVAAGELSKERLESYHKMQKEIYELSLKRGDTSNISGAKRRKGASKRVRIMKKKKGRKK